MSFGRQDENSTRVGVDIEIEMNSIPNPNPSPSPGTETETETCGLSDASIRQGFIFKVYGILSIQLCFTMLCIKALLFLTVHFKWAYFHSVIFLSPLMLIPFCCCCTNWKRKSPGHVVILVVFTLVEGSVLGSAVTVIGAPGIILFVGIIGTVTLCITLFAFQKKCGFTPKRGIVLVFIVVFLLNGLCAKFLIRIFPINSILVASFCAFWFCFGLVCDTQRLLRNSASGKEEDKDKRLTPDDYIYVALNIHLDVFLILYLLFVVPTVWLTIFLFPALPYGLPW